MTDTLPGRRLPVHRFYVIRVPGQWGWARIFLTDDGSISVLSDYGNFGYWFDGPGCEFRRFLIGADPDYYLTNKFTIGSPEVIDADASCAKIRRHILSRRRERDLSREDAANEWALIKEHSGLDDIFEQTAWYQMTELSEPWSLFVYERRSMPAVREFMKVCWPIFKAQLAMERALEELALTECLEAELDLDLMDPEIQGLIRW